MDFIERVYALSEKVAKLRTSIATEEATKNAFVMPFIGKVLGYDVFDPGEVIPEFTADVGTKKGEKVDYAIMHDGQPTFLVECKKCGESLRSSHASQLFRYFMVTEARIAILTNGVQYQFFTDIDSPNKMDEQPFLEIDFLNLDETFVVELKKLTKESFDLDSVLSRAGELKYTNHIKKLVREQFSHPDPDFVKFFAMRVYQGKFTQTIKEQFTDVTKRALQLFLSESIHERLKNALASHDESVNEVANDSAEALIDNGIVTTTEELEGFYIVKAILRNVVDIKRIFMRDTKSYFGILLDDNNRKPICRLHFNGRKKYIGLFDAQRKELRHTLQSLDELYQHSDAIIAMVEYYASPESDTKSDVSAIDTV